MAKLCNHLKLFYEKPIIKITLEIQQLDFLFQNTQQKKRPKVFIKMCM